MAKGELLGFVKDTKQAEILAYLKEEDVNKITAGEPSLL